MLRRNMVSTFEAAARVCAQGDCGGSLLERAVRHAKDCPKCARGEGHQVFVLTVTYSGGRTRSFECDLIAPEFRIDGLPFAIFYLAILVTTQVRLRI
jgi:hypothetical protein